MTPASALHSYLAERTPQNRDAVIAAHWYLCVRGAKRFARADVDRADLVQIGAIGLIKAVDGFDSRLRTPFEAYAWLLILGELLHYVRDHERLIRTPRRLRALERRYAIACEILAVRLDRHPTTAEIAAALGVSIAVVDELRLLRRGGAIVSLEAGTGSRTGELAAAQRGIGIDEHLSLRTALDALAERERIAVLGSFAAGLSQAEIGQRLGISQSQVSKLLKRALGKIQQRVA